MVITALNKERENTRVKNKTEISYVLVHSKIQGIIICNTVGTITGFLKGVISPDCFSKQNGETEGFDYTI
jgi:hypothetical protein